ncbi:MAG: hypothetical protein HYZ48_00695 [Chlamydiales bacterium]|nr:hypothetical protein [Chlamydiales bacterium]
MKPIKIDLSFISGSHGLYYQLQTIEDQLYTIKSSQEADRLAKKLDRTSLALQEMKIKAQDVFGGHQQKYFEELENEIIHLYGKIRNAWIARKVSQIQEETEELKKILDSKTPVDLKAINTLKKHIFLLLRDYRPGLEDRRIIADANQALLEAQLLGKASPSPKMEDTFDLFLDPSACEDLFDLAALVYNGRIREAKSQFHQLSEGVKQLFERHLRELMAVAFDDKIETIQALLATMNQLLQHPEPYATRNQIDEIFLGLQAVLMQEIDTHTRLRLPS